MNVKFIGDKCIVCEHCIKACPVRAMEAAINVVYSKGSIGRTLSQRDGLLHRDRQGNRRRIAVDKEALLPIFQKRWNSLSGRKGACWKSISKDPYFKNTLHPYLVGEDAPEIADMVRAGNMAVAYGSSCRCLPIIQECGS